MNNEEYNLYINDSNKAKELHDTIMEIGKEESWFKGVPYELLSISKVHSFARIKGLITSDELGLLKRFY